MASYTTDSIRKATRERILGGNTNRCRRILPLCEYTVSNHLERLSTFSKLTDGDVMKKISTVRLAHSGCVYNADEGYFECTGCAKVTMVDNAPEISTLYDLIRYHHQMCRVVSAYIEKQEKEIREGMINLHELKRFHRRFQQTERISYDELVQLYGIVQR